MATGRGAAWRMRQDVAVLGLLRRRRPALLVSTALQAAAVLVLALPARAQLAPNARPVGGQVVAGSAIISQPVGGTTTTITQSSARAALNWQGFNVGRQQTVQFAQPSASASTLNRVTGPDPSQIAGRIVANGQVVLVNQSGVVFAKGAQVDVDGLVVSAAGITNQNFMAGALKFDQPAQPNARVVNRGQITIRQAGLAALVAPRVANSGVISAKLGHVILAGAATQTLDMYGDGLVAIDVTGEVRQVPVGAHGKLVTALVTNTGTVIAAGGTVLLTARAADGIVQNLVDAGGRISAPTVGGHTGMIALQGVGGSILIAGQVEAVGAGAGERGGRIVANASDTVTLASGGALNASGRAGGGTVAFGTTLARAMGGPGVTAKRTARRAILEPGAVIAADATGNGSGGRVTVLSTDATAMGGMITARGGPQGGDGGFVEVSGGAGFSLTGGIDVSAPLGNVGAILLDPNDLDIVASGESSGITVTGGTVTATGPASPPASMVSAATLAALGTADVTVMASGTIDVQTNVSVANALSLQAGGLLMVDDGIAVSAGKALGLSAGGALQLGTGSTPVALSGDSVALGGASITLNNASVTATNGVSLATTAGGVTQSAAGVINSGSLTGNIIGGSANLNGTNTITALGGFVASGLTLADTTDLQITGPLNAGTVSLTASGLTETGGSIETALLTGSVAAVANLGGTNTITALGGFVANGLTLADTTDLQITGPLNAGTVSLTASGLTETGGSIETALLTGSVAAVANLGGTNTITALGGFVANGLTLADTTDLQITGPLNAGTVSLTANSLTETGGSVETALLTGSVAAGANLGGTNTITALGGFIASGLTLADTTDLQITGPLNAGTVSLTANSLTETGGSVETALLTGSVAAVANLGGTNTITALGGFVASGLTLADTTDLQITGPVNAGTVSLTASGLTETGGSIETALLTGSVAAVANLGGTNTITALGGFVANGLTLADTSDLQITGPLNAGTVSLTASGLTETGGSIETALLTGSVAAVANLGGTNTITALGGFVANGLTLADTSDLQITGQVNAGAVSLTANSLTETGGSVETALLTGSVAAGANLGGTNTITALGSFVGPTFTLVDSRNLQVSGPVTGGAVSLSAPSIDIPGSLAGTISVSLFADPGGITESGDLDTPALTGSAALGANLAGTTPTTNAVGSLNGFTVGTNFTLYDGVPLTIAGAVSAGTGGTIALRADSLSIGAALQAAGGTVAIAPASADIDMSVGLVAATGTLSIGQTDLAQIIANTIALGGFDASDEFARDLAIAGGISIAPMASTLALYAAGSITETGILSAPTLTGASGMSTSLGTGNLIATLSGFSAAGFTLQDTEDLTVAGVVNAGASAAINDVASTLTIDGAVNAGTVALSGGALAIPGSVTGTSTVNLASGGTIYETGSITTIGSLTGSAAMMATLTGINSIATLDAFVASGLSLDDTSNLTVAGVVNAGPSVAISDDRTLTIAPTGAITAASVSLASQTLGIAGAVNGTSSVDLQTTPDGMSESGVITTPLLTGDAVGSALLTGANVVGTLGGFTADGFSFVNAGSLAVSGPVNGGAYADIAASGSLTIDGGVAAGTVALSGSGVSIHGTVSGTSGVNLVSTDTIAEDGNIMASTLTGSATSAATLTGSNTIAALGSFTANGGFVLDNTADLLVEGVVNAGPSAAIDDAGMLTINASGTIIAGGVNLLAQTMAETGGVIVTPTLTGMAAGSATLAGANAISSLGSFTASGFTLDDTQALLVNGPLAGGPSVAVVDAGALNVAGNVQAAAVALTASSVGIAGAVAGANSVSLTASAGGISETGAISTALLTGSASAGVDLAGTNAIGTLGSFVASGFSLNAGPDLLISGPVGGGPFVTVTDAGALVVAGEVSGAAVVLTAAGIAIPGVLDGTGSVSLTATSGAIAETGAVNTAMLTGSALGSASFIGANAITVLGGFTSDGFTLVDASGLLVSGAVNGGSSVAISDAGFLGISGAIDAAEVALSAASIGESGVIATPLLTGGTSGAASFVGANRIVTLGSFSAQGFALSDLPDLSVAGPVQGGPSLAITDAGALTVTGQAAAATIGLAGASIAIPGSVAGASAVNLVATAGIAAPGQVSTALLTATTGGSASFSGANAIGALGNLTAATLTLQDIPDLDVVGLVRGGANVSIIDDGVLSVAKGDAIVGGVVGMTAPRIGIAGIVGAATELQLIAGAGGVDETGVILAAELDGDAIGPVNLAGANQIGAIGSFSLIPATAGTFRLADTGSLLLKGTLTSNLIVLDDTTGQIILGNGAAIVTGGSARQAGPFKAPSQASGGAFLTDFSQLGTSRVTGINGGPAVLDITAQNGGNITFASGGGGLYGPGTWLVLTLGSSGTASGNVFIQALDVQYFGTGGSAALSGTVGGLGGQIAAGAAGISPRTNTGYRFNACPIASVNCVLLPTEGLPPINPLQNISISGIDDTNPDDTLLLPIVSDRDY